MIKKALEWHSKIITFKMIETKYLFKNTFQNFFNQTYFIPELMLLISTQFID